MQSYAESKTNTCSNMTNTKSLCMTHQQHPGDLMTPVHNTGGSTAERQGRHNPLFLRSNPAVTYTCMLPCISLGCRQNGVYVHNHSRRQCNYVRVALIQPCSHRHTHQRRCNCLNPKPSLPPPHKRHQRSQHRHCLSIWNVSLTGGQCVLLSYQSVVQQTAGLSIALQAGCSHQFNFTRVRAWASSSWFPC
jgi:hypothetical protein